MQAKVIAVLIILFAFFAYGRSSAQPVINSVSGNFMDGQPVTIAGSGFGDHTLKIEWLGGTSGNIEQGTPRSAAFSGSSLKKGWVADGTAGGFQSPEYSAERAHSGSRSIKAYWPSKGQWGSGFMYDAGETISRIYVTWWVYWDWGGAFGGQWKLWRLRHNSDLNDSDGEIMQSDWYNVDGSHYQQYILCFCKLSSYNQCYPGAVDGHWMNTSGAIDTRAWTRLELYAEASSNAGVRDGTVLYNIHKQSTPVYKIKEDIGKVITRATGVTNQWRYFHWQNYLGDSLSPPGDHSVPKVYLDDIYLQIGTQARVELCDSNNWQNRKHCEIQPALSWGIGSVGISLNRGSFQNGNIGYLYVIDSKGNVSNSGQGYSITLGSNIQGASDPAPAPPKNLHVVN